jgi:hypothetical protein
MQNKKEEICTREEAVEADYAPGLWPDQHSNNLVLQHRCTLRTLVQSLHISRYVYSNKLVLS